MKNIPDDLYASLKRSAEVHRRSLNGEALVCLEAVLLPTTIGVEQRLARARQIRSSLRAEDFDADEVDRLKREGRP